MTLLPHQRQEKLLELLSCYMLGEMTQGQLLCYLRKQVLNLSQTKFAEMVNVSRRTISDIEQDHSTFSQSNINKVFKPFGLQAGLIPLHPHIAQKLMHLEQP